MGIVLLNFGCINSVLCNLCILFTSDECIVTATAAPVSTWESYEDICSWINRTKTLNFPRTLSRALTASAHTNNTEGFPNTNSEILSSSSYLLDRYKVYLPGP